MEELWCQRAVEVVAADSLKVERSLSRVWWGSDKWAGLGVVLHLNWPTVLGGVGEWEGCTGAGFKTNPGQVEQEEPCSTVSNIIKQPGSLKS